MFCETEPFFRKYLSNAAKSQLNLTKLFVRFVPQRLHLCVPLYCCDWPVKHLISLVCLYFYGVNIENFNCCERECGYDYAVSQGAALRELVFLCNAITIWHIIKLSASKLQMDRAFQTLFKVNIKQKLKIW